MNDFNYRAKHFNSAFSEKEAKESRNLRMTELRKNKRAEAVYSKRSFDSGSKVGSILDSEVTANYLRSNETEEFIKGASSFSSMINEPHDEAFIEICIHSLFTFSQFADPNRGFISTSILAGLSNSIYSHLLAPWISGIISLIPESETKVQENLYWILGNIALDSDANRESILTDEFLATSSFLIQNSENFIATKICWCISHCCKGKNIENQIKTIPFLSFALTQNLVDVFPEVLWALAHISEKSAGVVADRSCLEVIFKVLKLDVVKYQQPALRIVGNLISGSEDQVDLLVSLGVVRTLSNCLKNKSRVLRKETMWVLSNLAATKYIKELITKGLIKNIIDVSINDCQEIQMEGVWCLFNAISVSDSEIIKDLVSLGTLSALCYLLNCVGNRGKILLLKAVEKILKSGNSDFPNTYTKILESNGGKETIEGLIMNNNQSIIEKSSKILNDFFDQSSNEIDLVPPQDFEF